MVRYSLFRTILSSERINNVEYLVVFGKQRVAKPVERVVILRLFLKNTPVRRPPAGHLDVCILRVVPALDVFDGDGYRFLRIKTNHAYCTENQNPQSHEQ